MMVTQCTNLPMLVSPRLTGLGNADVSSILPSTIKETVEKPAKTTSILLL